MVGYKEGGATRKYEVPYVPQVRGKFGAHLSQYDVLFNDYMLRVKAEYLDTITYMCGLEEGMISWKLGQHGSPIEADNKKAG